MPGADVGRRPSDDDPPARRADRSREECCRAKRSIVSGRGSIDVRRKLLIHGPRAIGIGDAWIFPMQDVLRRALAVGLAITGRVWAVLSAAARRLTGSRGRRSAMIGVSETRRRYVFGAVSRQTFESALRPRWRWRGKRAT